MPIQAISVIGRQSDGTLVMGPNDAFTRAGERCENHNWLWVPQPDIKGPKLATASDKAAKELYVALEGNLPNSTFCSMLLAAGKSSYYNI